MGGEKRVKTKTRPDKYISMMTAKVTRERNGHIPLSGRTLVTLSCLFAVQAAMLLCVLSYTWHRAACRVVKLHDVLVTALTHARN